MSVFTVGIWTVKAGSESAFIEAWNALASRTQLDFPGSTATLLRDRDVANRFISFGPWSSIEDIEKWRASTTFADGVGRIKSLLEDFSPHTMDPVASIG